MDALVKAGLVFFGAFMLMNWVESFASSPDAKVKEVYIQVVNEFKVQYGIKKSPKLTQNRCDGYLGRYYFYENTICISDKAVNTFPSKSVIAFILAHELAHHYLRHDYGTLKREEQADKVAKNVITSIEQFRDKPVLKFMMYMNNISRSTLQTSHPSWANRYRYFKHGMPFPVESYRDKYNG